MRRRVFKNTEKLIIAIRKIAAFAVAMVFVCGSMWVPGAEFISEAQAADGTGGEYVEGEVIVCYVNTDDMNLSAGQEKESEKLLENADELITLEDVSLDDVDVDESKLTDDVQDNEAVNETMAIVSSDSKTTEELISEIEKLQNVDLVCPNYIAHLTEEEEGQPADEEVPAVSEEEPAALQAETAPDFTGSQWAFKSGSTYGMHIPGWNGTEENAGETVVALIDSGIDYKHPDLKNVMWSDTNGTHGKNVSVSPATDYPLDTLCIDLGDGSYFHSHGTHVAGIIAAEWNDFGVSGAAKGTKLMAVKATGKNGELSLKNIVEGYNYIKSKANDNNIVAINNSWGGIWGKDGGEMFGKVVYETGKVYDIVSVFAAGNYSADSDQTVDGDAYTSYYLRGNPYAIVVDSIGSNGYLSGFSNYGEKTTDVGAPGGSIYSTIISDENILEKIGVDKSKPYSYMSGTSMSAPAVSGEVAILAAKYPDAPADVITSIIKKNTENDDKLAGKCSSGGRADVQKALGADPQALKYRNFSLSRTSYTYDGTSKKPKVSELNLEEGIDYSVAYDSDTVNSGTHYAVVKRKGAESDTRKYSYQIKKATPKVSLNYSTYYCTGVNRYVSLSASGPGGEKWTKGRQYELTGRYCARLPGTYTVTVSPKDSRNFNSVSRSFKLIVKSTGISSLRGVTKGFRVSAGKQAKKYVTGYQLRYCRYSDMSRAKTITIGTKYYSVTKTVKTQKRNTKYYVQVRTYKYMNGKRHYSKWSSKKTVYSK